MTADQAKQRFNKSKATFERLGRDFRTQDSMRRYDALDRADKYARLFLELAPNDPEAPAIRTWLKNQGYSLGDL